MTETPAPTPTTETPAEDGLELFGIFVKDGETRTAYSQDDAVKLRWNGWSEQDPEELKGEALNEALDAAGKSKGGTVLEKRARLTPSDPA